jgi:DNA-directed RNA polymerase specialized sigma subunit
LSKLNGRNTGRWNRQTAAKEAAAALGMTEDQARETLRALHSERTASDEQDTASSDDAG